MAFKSRSYYEGKPVEITWHPTGQHIRNDRFGRTIERVTGVDDQFGEWEAEGTIEFKSIIDISNEIHIRPKL